MCRLHLAPASQKANHLVITMSMKSVERHNRRVDLLNKRNQFKLQGLARWKLGEGAAIDLDSAIEQDNRPLEF